MKLYELMGCVLPGQQLVIYVPDWEDRRGYEYERDLKNLLYMGDYDETLETWDDKEVCVVQTSPNDELLIGLVEV